MFKASTSAVIRVGEGRGFVLESRDSRSPAVVVTAAHCLPYLPPPRAASRREKRTYENLLGPLQGEALVRAECVFVDPIADVAVLRAADGRSLNNRSEAFDLLLEGRKPLRLWPYLEPDADATPLGFVLPLAATDWQPRALSFSGHWVNVDGDCESGMAGSPILSIDGSVVALVSAGVDNPILGLTLPSRIAELCEPSVGVDADDFA
jgi:hypothetical protein